MKIRYRWNRTFYKSGSYDKKAYELFSCDWQKINGFSFTKKRNICCIAVYTGHKGYIDLQEHEQNRKKL